MIRTFIRSLFTVITVLYFSSCSNDFDLIAEKKEIPIVYGFLSLSDTAQYFRVERAFVDENIAPGELAQIPDSLYYSNAIVTITDMTNNQVFTLERIDAALEGYPREEGAFISSPNYVYKIKTENIALIPNRQYMLTVNTGDNSVIASAITTLAAMPNLLDPREESPYAFSYLGDDEVKWVKPDNLEIFDINFYFHYLERDKTDVENDFVEKELVWNITKNVRSNKFQFPGLTFYEFLLNNLEVNPNLERRFLDFDCELVGGGVEFEQQINILQANTGITSSGETPVYSNITNGVGVFSTRNTTWEKGVKLNNRTLDSLQNSVLTQPLNFN